MALAKTLLQGSVQSGEFTDGQTIKKQGGLKKGISSLTFMREGMEMTALDFQQCLELVMSPVGKVVLGVTSSISGCY